MKRISKDDSWPATWKQSYSYDLLELYGDSSCFGYQYAYQNRKGKTLEMITDVLPAGSTVLDIAAAQGNFSLVLAEMGYRVTWNDLREDLEGYVRLKYERGDVLYRPGNAFDLDFADLFDLVLITEVIEHVAHPDEFLGKVARLVRPGGYVVVTTPNGSYFRNTLPKFSDCDDPSQFETVQFKPNSDGHIFLLHPYELQVLADKAGLTMDRLLLFTNLLTNGHCKTESLLKVLPKNTVFTLEKLSQRLPRVVGEKALIHMGARFVRSV